MEIHLDARDGYLRLNVSCRDAGPLPPRLLCPNVAPRVSRKSSNFSGRIVGAMFMRVNLKCVHQARPPLAAKRSAQPLVNP